VEALPTTVRLLEADQALAGRGQYPSFFETDKIGRFALVAFGKLQDRVSRILIDVGEAGRIGVSQENFALSQGKDGGNVIALQSIALTEVPELVAIVSSRASVCSDPDPTPRVLSDVIDLDLWETFFQPQELPSLDLSFRLDGQDEESPNAEGA
jgi:hypothetical protein